MVLITVHLIGDGMVAHIHQDEEILASYGFQDMTLAFSTAKAGNVASHDIIVFYVTVKGGIVLDHIIVDALAKLHQIPVDPISHGCHGRVYDQFQRPYGHLIFKFS